MLDDEEIREKEGREMEIIALATEKAKTELYQYHSYADKGLDSPILSPEAIEAHSNE